MALERTEVVDAIEIRPLLKQVGVTKTVTTVQDGEEVSKNAYSIYFSQEDDISGEDTLVQTIANHYWGTL
jgi:plasmid rolling circle replication initiator protein Rep